MPKKMTTIDALARDASSVTDLIERVLQAQGRGELAAADVHWLADAQTDGVREALRRLVHQLAQRDPRLRAILDQLAGGSPHPDAP